MTRRVLAGDIGATKTLLGLFSVEGADARLERHVRYSSRDFPNLESICANFLVPADRIDAAGFGVPGVVIDQTAVPSNLAWRIDAASLSRALGGAPVRLENDMAACALGVLHLRQGGYEVLQEGSLGELRGNVAVIAAGTGLGEAALVYSGGNYHPVAAEGGHSSFAPIGERQAELLRFLAAEYGHVSWERVLSGPGLANIYRFLSQRSGRPDPPWPAEAAATQSLPVAISSAAMKYADPICVDALQMFCAIYGSEAANLALKVLALGGVYLCGGIAPQIISALKQGAFTDAFVSKGRLKAMLEKIEIRVVTDPHTALLGAAHSAVAALC